MGTVEKSVQIAAPIDRVWAALTDAQAIRGWMDDSKVEVDLKIGGAFRLFDGSTTGRFLRLSPPSQLAYTWRQAEWKSGWPDSAVEWTLAPDREGTRVSLVHRYFPNEKERDSHDEGWDLYWLGPMKEWLEAGN